MLNTTLVISEKGAYISRQDTPLLMCSECVSLSVNFYRKSEGVRMRGHETSSSAQRDVHEFLSFSHRKWMLLD